MKELECSLLHWEKTDLRDAAVQSVKTISIAGKIS